MSDLKELIARVEGLSGADREVDEDIYRWIQPEYANFVRGRGGLVHPNDGEDQHVLSSVRAPAYTSSIDAALAFAERVLPGWFVAKIDAWNNANEEVVGYGVTVQKFNVEPYVTVKAGWIGCTLPLAIILATLKAKDAE